MSTAIQNIMQKTLGDGARASKFEVLFEFSNPSKSPTPQETMMLVKTTSFPGLSHSTIDFKYKGRSIPIRGQTKYTQTWDCTFYLSQDHELKYSFDNWISALDETHGYALDGQDGSPLNETRYQHAVRGYTTTIKLYQRDFDDTASTAEYTLNNVFPTEVTPIQYGYDITGQIQEFTVTFSYSYFTMSIRKGTAGNFIDNAVDKFKNKSKSLIDSASLGLSKTINTFLGDNIGNTFDKLNNSVTSAVKKSDFDNAVSGGLGEAGMATSLNDITNSNARFVR